MKQHIENLKHPPGMPMIEHNFDLNISPTFPIFTAAAVKNFQMWPKFGVWGDLVSKWNDISEI